MPQKFHVLVKNFTKSPLAEEVVLETLRQEDNPVEILRSLQPQAVLTFEEDYSLVDTSNTLFKTSLDLVSRTLRVSSSNFEYVRTPDKVSLRGEILPEEALSFVAFLSRMNLPTITPSLK